MGIKKKHVPGCGCCSPSVPPIWECCPGGRPATLTLVVSGAPSGNTGIPCAPELDCSSINGTHTAFQTFDNCLWRTSNIPNSDPAVGPWRIDVYWELRGATRHITVRVWCQFVFFAPMVEASVPDSSACTTISGVVVELLGDQVDDFQGCCAWAAASEVEISA